MPGTRVALTGRQDVETGRSYPGRCTRGTRLVGAPPSLSCNYVLPPRPGVPRACRAGHTPGDVGGPALGGAAAGLVYSSPPNHCW